MLLLKSYDFMKGILFFLASMLLSISTPDISDVRAAYRNAIDSQENAENLYAKLTEITAQDDPLLLGYKGATATILANFAKGVKVKTTYFKEGKKLLEQAIATNPKSVELRYLRLSVQENAPKVVRYKKHIPEDKQFILDHYQALKNAETKKYIKGFVSQSTSFTQAEKQLF